MPASTVVRDVQAAINRYLNAHGLPVDRLDVDGEFGPKTAAAIREVKLCLGYKPKYATDEVTTAFVNRVKHWRTVRLYAPRMIARGIAYRRSLRKRRPLHERAYLEATKLVGIMERGGNNRGADVERIIRENQGDVGEPWCGDFQAYCYRHAGSKAVTRSWASVRLLGSLVGVAKTNRPVRGDLVRFTFDHVGMFVKDVGGGQVETIEGNTGRSGAVSDSATGGDGVYRKRRAKSLVQDYRHITR